MICSATALHVSYIYHAECVDCVLRLCNTADAFLDNDDDWWKRDEPETATRTASASARAMKSLLLYRSFFGCNKCHGDRELTETEELTQRQSQLHVFLFVALAQQFMLLTDSVGFLHPTLSSLSRQLTLWQLTDPQWAQR